MYNSFNNRMLTHPWVELGTPAMPEVWLSQ